MKGRQVLTGTPATISEQQRMEKRVMRAKTQKALTVVRGELLATSPKD